MSIGTVWTVGGLAPVSTGVPSGRGGLLASGTNAPLYTTSFSATRQNEHEDLEKHEGRLAEALELDRVSRVLEFRDPSSSPLKQASHNGTRSMEPESKTFWKGTEWILGGSEQGKLNQARNVCLDIANFNSGYCTGNQNSPNFSFQISISSTELN